MQRQIFVLIFKHMYAIMFYVTNAGVAELADAHDSKSCALKACRFESDLRHHIENKRFTKKTL